MITSYEAKQITNGTLTPEAIQHLEAEAEKRIRQVASQGQTYLNLDSAVSVSSASRDYLRKKLIEQGFKVSETGLTIYW